MKKKKKKPEVVVVVSSSVAVRVRVLNLLLDIYGHVVPLIGVESVLA